MIRRTRILLVAALLVALGAMSASPARAASPAFEIHSNAGPSYFPAGNSDGFAGYGILVKNVGGAPTDGSPITITDTLPDGVSFHSGTPAGDWSFGVGWNANERRAELCDPGPPITCTTPSSPIINGQGFKFFDPVLKPGAFLQIFIPVDVAANLAGTTAVNQITVSGGGAATASITESTPVSDEPTPFGFQDSAFSLTDADGNAATLAGSHPQQANFFFLLNSADVGENSIASAGGKLRDAKVTLPPGMVINPQATQRCTEAQLESNDEVNSLCPDASAVGVFHAYATFLGIPSNGFAGAVYNMVPSPGAPAELAIRFGGPGGIEIIAHIRGGVDSSGEYRLTGESSEIFEFASTVGIDLDLWGSPSNPAYDSRRGACAVTLRVDPDGNGGQTSASNCPVPRTDTPFLTMPSACSGPLETTFSVDSWQDSGNFLEATAQSEDSSGNPVGVVGCNSLDFAPTLKARPTTNLADSPSGLSVDLAVPQTESVSERATSNLRKTVVRLPEGLVVNPSGANGLEACSSSQIGLSTAVGSTPIHFSATSPNCPVASKIGTVEVDTPLLEDPLHGAVYIAAPHDNPFDSLLAIYIVVDDPETGVVLKLAGQVEPDPESGRLTTTVDENPQLPFSHFRLEFFQGANAPLRTPVSCGPYSTSSELSPWSGNPPAAPHDDYSISGGANNGDCHASPAEEPNSPSFDAGTVSPVAKAFSPFVLNLDRNDGTQRFSTVLTSPPAGLVAKLAGTPACSEGALAAAASKSGRAELASPSCPSDSQVGSVHVAAGAGPAPYWAAGKVYLAGPYKGGPLSLAVIVPATAGPFDLGTVASRVALQVDPVTARITATSDPIPQILQGILLDVRSVRLSLDKPNFTLNGTSCDPGAIEGRLTSTLGQVASLSQRFQLGECGRLGFKPKMTIKLKGGTGRGDHPALTVVLTPRPGDANIASLSLAMPRSEFLDQAHIRTICTRVQFTADACPAGAVYGEATVQTPILDYPLTGHVYLRSSNNTLPDLVPDLRGPAYQPLRVESAGRTDSIKGGIRNTFDFVPDAPFSKLVTQLQGGKKGLLVNSRNICANVFRATVKYTAHNGASFIARPKVQAQCGGRKAGGRKR